ncbi:hypothetical protein IKD67_00840 [Candidatus Saccharibacteria bacterium]|nr:hypothetical protein [Candidatus Saccharibacteria bacterium]
MNKDVIYIEPEDDITDIILKIENSKEKIVALVPPKKAGVFRSIVNIKLISKAGASSEKTVVLVTVDPSIVKLAATAKLPVTKDLQSAPTIPAVDESEEPEEESEEELVEEEDGTVETEDEVKDLKPSKSEKTAADADEEDDEDEDADEDEEEAEESAKKSAKSKKNMKLSGNKLLDWIKLHKKLAIFAGVALVGLVGFLIWAFGFAPAADITVAIKTDQKNFSENISFTDNLANENAKEGKFYLEQKKLDSVQEVNFDATGQKNRGNKATGEVVFEHVFRGGGTYSIDTITINGLTFYADSGSTISWNDKLSLCENIKGIKDPDEAYSEYKTNGCRIDQTVKVTASEPGEKYNIPKTCGWLSLSGISGCSSVATTGGSDDIITVVQQGDVEKAKNELTSAKEDEYKSKLYETIDDNYYVIDSTFEIKTDSATATPGVDEEVKSGTQPVLKATTTATVYVIDKVKLEEFIREKADLADDQKIYDVRDIYIENISEIKEGATTKLKAQYFLGPKITESEVVDKIKGKGLGDAQREIRDIYGVSDVKINTSYPWVMSIPGDSNKVKVTFEVKDQDGHEIKEKDENTGKDENSEENKDSESDKKESEEKK